MNSVKITKTKVFNKLAIAVAMASAGVIANAAELEEVVVTAQKHAQSVNDIGITVNAFTGDTIKDMGVSSAEDIAVFTPGLTVNATSSVGVPVYSIRGVGFQDYSTGASSTVGLYFDEVAMPYTVMSRGAIFDIARVEVLKGPQGDLYGRNTTAGQINYISKKPREEFEAGVTASYGRFDVLDVEGFVSGGISDSVQARLALKATQSSEGWQQSLTRDDELGEQDTTAARAIFNVDFNDDANLFLTMRYAQDKSDNLAATAYNGEELGLSEFDAPYRPLQEYIIPGGANFGQTPPWYSTGDNRAADWTNNYTNPITGKTISLRPRRDNELKGITAKLEWDFGDVVLTSITAYDDFTRSELNDGDGLASVDGSSHNKTDIEVFSQEIRLSGEADNLLWIAGLYYSDDEVDEDARYFMADSVFGLGSVAFGVEPFASTPILELDTLYDQQTESKAVFGHVEWQFTEQARLTLGLRYTEEERSWSGCTYATEDGSLAGFLNAQFGSTLGPGDCGTIDDDPNSPNFIFANIGSPDVNDSFHVYKDTIETEKWMGKIGLDYAINDDVLVYATYSQAFKSGGFNGANSNTTLQLQPYGEEELSSFEVGMKSTLLDGSMQLNMAAFWYDYEDKQETDLAVAFVGNISGLTNVPESRINGAELDLQWAPLDGLTLGAGIAYLDTLVEEWQAVSAASAWPNVVTFDASGLELSQSPEWSYNAMFKYEWLLSSSLMLEVGGDANYKDNTTGGAQPREATESYAIYNLRAGIGDVDGDWRLLLWGRNVTDEDYYPAAYLGGNGAYVRSNGMPATYGVTFAYNF